MPGILVVEDDENLNRGITFSLKKSGYEVFSAESVKKAKRIASDNNVDVAICDVNLPDGNGLELVRWMRNCQNVYIICLGIGNGGFTNGVQVIVDDAIYERLTGKDTYSEFLPTLNEGADREIFDTFIEAFCDRTPGTTFLSYEESDQQLKESFAQIQMLAWGLILFVGLIGILNIINTVYTNIHTRVTEIGMQRAIGMSAGSLYKTFLWEGAYYGVIASVIGSVLGYVCTIFIEAATSDTIQLVAIPVMPILEATLLAVGACLLATAIPLRKISKMSIVDSIETVE